MRDDIRNGQKKTSEHQEQKWRCRHKFEKQY